MFAESLVSRAGMTILQHARLLLGNVGRFIGIPKEDTRQLSSVIYCFSSCICWLTHGRYIIASVQSCNLPCRVFGCMATASLRFILFIPSGGFDTAFTPRTALGGIDCGLKGEGVMAESGRVNRSTRRVVLYGVYVNLRYERT